jgi:hypothetical protein
MPATAPHSTARPVRPGDIVVFSGTPHLIVSTDARTKAGNPIAKAADGWGISLEADGTLSIPCPNERWCVIHAEDVR